MAIRRVWSSRSVRTAEIVESSFDELPCIRSGWHRTPEPAFGILVDTAVTGKGGAANLQKVDFFDGDILLAARTHWFGPNRTIHQRPRVPYRPSSITEPTITPKPTTSSNAP